MQALQTCASRLALRLEPCRTRTQDVSQRGRTTIDVVLLHFLHYFHSFIPSSGTKKRRGMMPWRVAPQVRLELTTLRLTAECSAIELLRIIFSIHLFCYVWEREKLPFLPLPVDPGNFLLSQAVPSSVPSAFGGLTSVFGMGTGGALQLSSPETFRRGASRFLSASLRSSLPRRALSAVLAPPPRTFKTAQVRVDQQTPHSPSSSSDQALDRLVSASSTPHSASTADLSTSSSLRGLTCFMQWQSSSSGGLHA